MKKFDLTLDSIAIGKSSSYLNNKKKVTPVLFRFCCFYSKKSLVEGFNKLMSYYQMQKDDVQHIYFSFEQPYVFCKWLFENDIYVSVRAGYSVNFIFNQSDMIRIDCIYKLKNIKKAWAIKNV